LVLDNQKNANAISLHVKSSIDKTAWADKVQILVDSTGKLKPGEVKHLAGSDEEEDDEDVNYEIEKPQKEGPSHVEETVNPPEKKNSTGDSDLKIDWTGAVQANQEFSARDGKFGNHFVTNGLTVVNASQNPIAVTKVTAEWQDKDGNWKQPARVLVGVEHKSYGYSNIAWQPETSTNFN